MKNIVNYISERYNPITNSWSREFIPNSKAAQTKKYGIDRTDKSHIIVWDTENAQVSCHCKTIEGAQKYADDFDKEFDATNKVIKSADHNCRWIVIDFDNPSEEAQECIDTWELSIDDNGKIKSE